MALEKFGPVPYEVLVRFHFGGDHQRKDAKLGDFEGAHYIDASGIRDTETGEVVTFTPGQAQSLPRERIAELLGERFAEFEAQFRALDADHRALQQLLEQTQKELAASVHEAATAAERVTTLQAQQCA